MRNSERLESRTVEAGRLGVLATLIFASITIQVICGCVDNPVDHDHPEWVYGGEPLADSMVWSSSNVIWSGDSLKKPYSLMVVSASWCGWCKKLVNETFADSSVMGLVDKYFDACVIATDSDSLIAIEGDSMSGFEAGRKFGIRGYPTTLFFDKNGNQTKRIAGFVAAESFAEALWRVAKGK